MKHDFTVYADSGLSDSVTSAVQIAFTLTPSVHGSGTCPPSPVVCKTMKFSARDAQSTPIPKQASESLANSSIGVGQEATWEWETMFAFSKYEPINSKQRRLVGELWPTSPGQSRTIGNRWQQSSTKSYHGPISFSQTSSMGLDPEEDQWFISESLHMDAWPKLTEGYHTNDNLRNEEWGRPQSYLDLDPLNHASMVAINHSSAPQNVALYIRDPTDQLFDTIAVYDSVPNGGRVIASSYLLLQAYIVSYEVSDYDLLPANELGSPIFEQPLQCDYLPPSSKWRLCKDERQKIRLVMDDLDLWSMKKRLDAVIATVNRMETTDATTITRSFSSIGAQVTSLDHKLTMVSEAMAQNLQDHVRATGEHFTHLSKDASLVQNVVHKLEGTVSEQAVKLAHLPVLVKRAHETQEELTVTQRSVEEIRSEGRAVKAKVDVMETQRNRADQELSALQKSLNNTQKKVNVIERSLDETQAGLHGMIENAFRDSRAIQVIMDSKIEQQSTTIINSTLASNVESRLSIVETKTDRLENKMDSVAAKPEVTRVPRELEESVRAVAIKVGNTEAALSKLEESIQPTILETISRQHVREEIATAVRDSVVIQEFKNKMIQRSEEALTSDVEPRLMAVEQMFDVMEPRLSAVEAKVGDESETLGSGVGPQSSDVEAKMAEISESYHCTQEDVSLLRKTVSDLGTLIDDSRNDLAEHWQAVETTKNRLDVAYREIDGLKELSNTTTNTRLSPLETAVGSIGSGLVGVTAKIGGLTESLSQTHDQMVTSFIGARKHAEELSRKLSGRLAPLEDLRLEEFVPNFENRLGLVTSHLDLASDRLGKVETSVDDIQHTVTSGWRTKADKNDVNLLEQHVSQMKKEVSCLTDLKTSLQSLGLNLKASITACQTDIVSVGTKTEDTLSVHQALICNTQADVTKLRESIATLEGSVVTSDGVSEVSENLKSSLAAAEEQLRARLVAIQSHVAKIEGRAKLTHDGLIKTRQDLDIVHRIAVSGHR